MRQPIRVRGNLNIIIYLKNSKERIFICAFVAYPGQVQALLSHIRELIVCVLAKHNGLRKQTHNN